jgi:lipoprotein-releasing system ATP-binding protein
MDMDIKKDKIPAIKATDLSKSFQKDGSRIEILKNLDFEIAAGESVAILGASGAGKSTLLHILGTLDHPSSGSLFLNGEDVFKFNEQKLAELRNRKIGFVFQFHHLLPEFSSLENVMMPALISGVPKKEARRRAEFVLNEVNLGDRITHKPGELSGGEQQRVAVARAVIMEPDLILADEPTGNLDTETGERVQEVLINLNRKLGITLIVVTHNQLLAERLDRSIGLRDGKISGE